MKISKELVQAFKSVYERKLGQNISAEEAEQKLSDLAELIRIIENRRRKNGY
ncbi:hypothetical protein J6X73_01240 [Candidatus Saccharibacteria bacterium]|nr:hypothetical protein [Candidatus Saccharibacteria bacterium]